MFTRFGEIEPSFQFMDELRRRMDRIWDEFDTDRTGTGASSGASAASVWPRVSLSDAGANLVLKADVPGMTEKDLNVTLNEGGLAISGQRKLDTMEGYSIHRQERAGIKFARTLSLPCKVNPEQVSASVKDGVLTITLAKAPEAQPRQITIRAQ